MFALPIGENGRVGETGAALERYERAAEAGRAQPRVVLQEMTAEAYGVPAYPSYAAPADKRAAEDRDRREWLEAVSRRLRLVAEVHRVRVWKRGEGDWARRCLRPGCPAGRPLGWAPSQECALGDALAHAGAFMPLAVYEEPSGGLDWAGYVPLLEVRSPLRWHYGPTEADPDPGSMWCCDCGGEVSAFDGVYVCGCGRQSEGS